MVDGMSSNGSRLASFKQNKGEFVTKNTVYNASQFDSKQSEYFLILNEKNKAIVKKRQLQKQQEYDDDLKQFEEEY